MALVTAFFVFLLALFVVVKSSSYFVQFAAKIAKRFGISEFVIGLTLVAIGTSLPELTNMILSSLRNVGDLSLGNVLGANMANIGLTMGICTIIGVIHIIPELYRKEKMILLSSTIAFYFFALNGVVSSLEGFLLVVGFGAYILYITKLFEEFRRYIHPAELAQFIYHLAKVTTIPDLIKKNLRGGYQYRYKPQTFRWERAVAFELLGAMASAAVLVFAADKLVTGAITIAQLLGLANAAIGATIVAIGTTTPELSVSLASVKKGYHNMLIGNLLGSNVVNILLIVGLGAIIRPLAMTAELTNYALPLVLTATAIFSFSLSKQQQLKKTMGIIFLGIYLVFLGIMIWL